MNRILSALVASVAFLTLSAPSFADTAMSAASPSAMKAPAPKVTPAGNHTCPKGSTYVKGYTKSDGTKVKGYCRTASTTTTKSDSMSSMSSMKGDSMKAASPAPAATK